MRAAPTSAAVRLCRPLRSHSCLSVSVALAISMEGVSLMYGIAACLYRGLLYSHTPTHQCAAGDTSLLYVSACRESYAVCRHII